MTVAAVSQPSSPPTSTRMLYVLTESQRGVYEAILVLILLKRVILVDPQGPLVNQLIAQARSMSQCSGNIM
jgi:hypothetical protein